MAKQLRVRDRFLLGLAIAGDLSFEACEPLSIQLKKAKGLLPPDYKVTQFRSSVSKILKTGNIEKVIKEGEPCLRLTGKGRSSLVRDFSLFDMRRKKWDGLWRIVFYDIPEKQKSTRQSLKIKLQELGFGMVQESVYLSPFNVADDLGEFLVAHGLSEMVFVSVGRKIFGDDSLDLVKNVWHLDKLQEKYEQLYQKILESNNFDEAFREYMEVLEEDPCLPLEFLPRDWIGEKVYTVMKGLIRKRLAAN